MTERNLSVILQLLELWVWARRPTRRRGCLRDASEGFVLLPEQSLAADLLTSLEQVQINLKACDR